MKSPDPQKSSPFFDAVSNGKTPSPGPVDAVESLKIALAEPIARTGWHCRSKSLEGARSLGAAERLARKNHKVCLKHMNNTL
jgi:hypothetical protein